MLTPTQYSLQYSIKIFGKPLITRYIENNVLIYTLGAQSVGIP